MKTTVKPRSQKFDSCFESLREQLTTLDFSKTSLDLLPQAAIKEQEGSYTEIWESSYALTVIAEIPDSHSIEDIERLHLLIQDSVDVHLSDLYHEEGCLKDGYIFLLRSDSNSLTNEMQEYLWDLEEDTTVALKRVINVSSLSSNFRWDRINRFPFGNRDLANDITPSFVDFEVPTKLSISGLDIETKGVDILLVEGTNSDQRRKTFRELHDLAFESFYSHHPNDDADRGKNELEMISWLDQLRSEMIRYPSRKYLITFNRNVNVRMLIQKMEELDKTIKIVTVKRGVDKPRVGCYTV